MIFSKTLAQGADLDGHKLVALKCFYIIRCFKSILIKIKDITGKQPSYYLLVTWVIVNPIKSTLISIREKKQVWLHFQLKVLMPPLTNRLLNSKVKVEKEMNKADLPAEVAECMKEEAAAFSSNTFASSSWDFSPWESHSLPILKEWKGSHENINKWYSYHYPSYHMSWTHILQNQAKTPPCNTRLHPSQECVYPRR